MDYLLESQKQRRDNLKRLLADYSTQRDFGEAVGLAASQISHMSAISPGNQSSAAVM